VEIRKYKSLELDQVRFPNKPDTEVTTSQATPQYLQAAYLLPSKSVGSSCSLFI